MAKPQWTDHDRETVQGLLAQFWKIPPAVGAEYVRALAKFYPSTAIRCVRNFFQNAENGYKPAPGALAKACAEYAKRAHAATKKPDEDRKFTQALTYLTRCSYFDAIVEWEGAVWKLERTGLMLIGDPRNPERERQRGYLGGIKPYRQFSADQLCTFAGQVQMAEDDRRKVSDEEIWRERPLHEHLDNLRTKETLTEAQRWLLALLERRHQHTRNARGLERIGDG